MCKTLFGLHGTGSRLEAHGEAAPEMLTCSQCSYSFRPLLQATGAEFAQTFGEEMPLSWVERFLSTL